MEFAGRLTNISFSYETGCPLLTFEMDKNAGIPLENFEQLMAAEKLTVKVGRFTKKRSLDANGYAWVLISKIAATLSVDKVDVYRRVIREIGGVSDVVCVQDKAVQKLCEGWEKNGLGWQSETFPSKIKGCTNVTLYYGTSTYDTRQMSLLINHLVEEARSMGIETMPPDRLAALIGENYESS